MKDTRLLLTGPAGSGLGLTLLAVSAAGRKLFIILGLLPLMAGAEPKDQAKADPGPAVETRGFVLAGYIPQFQEPTVDPFDENAKGKLEKYKEGIVSYLKGNGIDARKVEYSAASNGLILTDTPENLDSYERMLRLLFSPDMQLRAIEGTKRALADKTLFEGDLLSRVVFADDVTFRAFHSEVRKLEEALAVLPDGHEERKTIEARLNVAKAYRQSAIQIYLESLEKQEVLVKKWQMESLK